MDNVSFIIARPTGVTEWLEWLTWPLLEMLSHLITVKETIFLTQYSTESHPQEWLSDWSDWHGFRLRVVTFVKKFSVQNCITVNDNTFMHKFWWAINGFWISSQFPYTKFHGRSTAIFPVHNFFRKVTTFQYRY